MAQLTIRNLDDDVQAGLRVRAAQNHRSMEAEVRAILTLVVREASGPEENLAAWLRKRLKGLEGDVPVPRRSKGRAPPRFR
jgi:plasmid stability protein